MKSSYLLALNKYNHQYIHYGSKECKRIGVKTITNGKKKNKGTNLCGQLNLTRTTKKKKTVKPHKWAVSSIELGMR